MEYSVQNVVVCSVLVVICVTSAIIDYHQHRIPNWLSFSGWYLGPILHLVFSGFPAASGSVMGLLLVLTLTFPLFVANWMGAGDVKLMTSVGALVGIEHALLFLMSIVITGLLLAVVKLLRQGQMGLMVRRYWVMLGLSVVSGKPVYLQPGCEQAQAVMPYAVSISTGTVLALALLWF